MRSPVSLRWMLCLGFSVAAVGPRAAAKSPEPEPAAAPAPNPQPPPAAETEPATTGKAGPRPLMGLTARPGASAELPKPPRDPAERRAWLGAQLDAAVQGAGAGQGEDLGDRRGGGQRQDRSTRATTRRRSTPRPTSRSSPRRRRCRCSAPSTAGARRWRWSGPPSGPPLPAGGEVSGDLYLRGSGDPTLSTEDLAAMVERSRCRSACTRFTARWSSTTACSTAATSRPAYDQKNDSTASRAPSSAASLDGNVVGVTIIPGAAAGAAGAHRVEPASPYFTVAGRVVTAAQRPGRTQRRHQGGRQPHARQRRRARQAGRRSAHDLPAGRRSRRCS